ncbi:MAG: SCO family protein [Planctomycetes bacterium]|nr:SCO family protein [Planctomycetota bacterium]
MSLKLNILALFAALFAASLAAQSTAQIDYELQGVDVVEKIGKSIPLDLTFTDDNDRHIQLRQYFKPGRPVLITINYADCPNLCDYQLTDLAKAFKDMDWVPGKEFIALRVSVDPKEDYKRAKQSKLRYLGLVGKADADAGWHFLTTTSEDDVKKLADALGYGYTFDGERGLFRHKAALMIVNGEGKISHYLRNIGYEPKDVQAQLEASAEGKFGQPSEDDNGFGLNCFTLPYTDNMARAYNMMRAGGVGILVFLFSFLGYWWYREIKKPREEQVQAEAI